MKTRILTGAIVAASLALAGRASAAETPTTSPYQSPQNFALELRFSPYYPDVDKEPGLRGTPFKNRFGDSPRVYVGLELDWQVLRIPHLGSFGPGLAIGKVSMSRNATTLKTHRPSGDEYSLDIYPLVLNAVFRADVVWQDLKIPLVPYAKLGLGLGLWKSSNSGGTSETQLAGESKPVKGEGKSLGTNVALGAAFALDSIDSGAARNMDNAVGINHTYVYGEYYWLNLDGFGSANALYVGTKTWAAGLAFEF